MSPPKSDKKAPARVSPEEALLKAVTRAGGRLADVQRSLARLEATYGEAVYPALIRLLTRLEFPPARARRHWQEVVRHAGEMAEALGREPDFRVALADYFVSRRRKIRHPMVVEIHLYQKTEAASLSDGLTGLFNFRYMKNLAPRMVAHARRTGQTLGLAFFDLDDFKAYNDRFGHEAGNVLLKRISGVLTDSIREMDIACRYGGEEFALVLPGADKFGALAVAERVRGSLERLAVPAARPGRCVTVSAGVACFPVDAESADDLLTAADSAMYHAKSLGKNRVELFSPERRSADRLQEHFTARCTLDRSTFRLKGENLAKGGLYGVSERPVETGTSVAVVIDVPSTHGRRAVVKGRARVTRCEPLGDGSYGLGLTLTRLSPADRKRYETALAACGRG